MGNAVVFWPIGHGHAGYAATALPVEERTWQLLAGALFPCDVAEAALLQSGESVTHGPIGQLCLFLVGWDGEQLPVATVPLRSGPLQPPAKDAELSLRFNAPLPQLDAQVSVIALHLEPQVARLWALLSSGELHAWDLLQSRALGR